MKHYVKDSSNSLDSIRERVALTILVDFISITRENNNNNNKEKIVRKLSGKKKKKKKT